MKLKIVSHNSGGLRTSGKLSATLIEASKKEVDILLIQEHNFTIAQQDEVNATARNRGYHACVGYVHRNGGSAIFAREDTFPDTPPKHACMSALGGRVTTMELTQREGKRLKVASMYVPAKPNERLHFLMRLSNKSILENVDVCGMDANCVPDKKIDTKKSSAAAPPYSNLHAARLEDLLAELGLRDVYRLMHGRTPAGFTRECSTIATRIDRIYTKIGGQMEWLAIRANATFNQVSCPSDHRAVEATMQMGRPPVRMKGEKKIVKHAYHREEIRESITALVTSITDRYPPSSYGWETVFKMLKPAVRDLMLHMQGSTGRIGAATLMDQTIQKISKEVSVPSERRKLMIDKVTNSWREVCGKRKEIRGAAAHTRIEAEERCTKRFHARFKNKGTKTTIQEIFPMEGTEIALGAQAVESPEEIAEQAATYYESLMSAKPSEPNAREALLALFRSKPISKRMSENMEDHVTCEEVKWAIRKTKWGKAPGPDGLHTELYKCNEKLFVPMLTSLFNEALERGALPSSMKEGIITLLFKKKDPRDIRNYRPITLLNTDYKILARVLSERLKKMMDKFVGSQQTGFVPGRQITDNTRLCQLIQACLEEKTKKGLCFSWT